MRPATKQGTSLGELERVIEPRTVHDAVYNSVTVLNDALAGSTGSVLGIIQSQNQPKLDMLIKGLERQKSEANKAQIEGSIEAIHDLGKLLSGEHSIVEKMKEERARFGYNEKRSDGLSLKPWVAEHSKKIMTHIRETIYPSGSVKVTGESASLRKGDGCYSL